MLGYEHNHSGLSLSNQSGVGFFCYFNSMIKINIFPIIGLYFSIQGIITMVPSWLLHLLLLLKYFNS